jgi:hypothetical protein
MKQLSERQARNCEEAKGDICKCRCGGALHGSRRGGDDDTPREFFEQLPEDDPHHLPPKKRRKKQVDLSQAPLFDFEAWQIRQTKVAAPAPEAATPDDSPTSEPITPPAREFQPGDMVAWGKGMATRWGKITSITGRIVDIDIAFGAGHTQRNLEDLSPHLDPDRVELPPAEETPQMPPLPWLARKGANGTFIIAADGTELGRIFFNQGIDQAVAELIIQQVNQAAVTA